MPNAGDVVLYSAYGRVVNAIVLDNGNTEEQHQGKNGEPSLTLAFIDPEREQGGGVPKIGPLAQRPGYFPTVFTEHDVVHHTQEFTEEYKRLKGLITPAQVASARGQGEWMEKPSIYTPAEPLPIETAYEDDNPTKLNINYPEGEEPAPVTQLTDVDGGTLPTPEKPKEPKPRIVRGSRAS